jgi:CheY-like chemotaxis protein
MKEKTSDMKLLCTINRERRVEFAYLGHWERRESVMSISNDRPRANKPLLKTILLVEDDVSIGELLMKVLQEEGLYDTVLVTDGFQALKVVKTIHPLLFVLDYQLPGMDGFELYDRLHTTEGLGGVPALFVSANVPLKELEKRHLQYIRKPFELDQLLDAIEKHIAA